MGILRNILMAIGLLGTSTYAQNFTSLNVNDFERAIRNKKVTLVDVRRPDEYASGHIQGAININVQDTTFKSSAIRKLNKRMTVAVYCRSGRRSKTAANILSEIGFSKIIELNTGIVGWQNAGKKIETK